MNYLLFASFPLVVVLVVHPSEEEALQSHLGAQSGVGRTEGRRGLCEGGRGKGYVKEEGGGVI